MAQNTLGTGVLVLKANSSALDQSLDKSSAKIKDAEKKANASAAGFKAGLFLAMGSKVLEGHARRMEEEAKRIQGIMLQINDAAGKAEAQRLGIIPSDSDIAQIERGERAWSGWGKRLDSIINQTGIDELFDNIGKGADKLLGIAPKVDPKVEKDFLEAQAKQKAAMEERKKTIEDFDKELEKNAATIGMSAREIKIWGLVQMHVPTKARAVKQLSNDINKLTDDLKKSIEAIGKTAAEIELLQMARENATDKQLAETKRLEALRQSVDRGFSLITKDPVNELAKDLRGLEDALGQGKMSLDEYYRSLSAVSKAFIDANQSEKKFSTQALKAGSKEAYEFLVTSKASLQNADPAKMLTSAIEDAKGIWREQLAAMKQLDRSVQANKINVVEVDVR